MKKQKICIIGDGLAGLTSTFALKNLNIDIDFYCKKEKGRKKDDIRATAISDLNLKFLQKIINFKNSKLFWSCKNIDLFYENKKKIKKFLNLDNQEKSLMHIFENKKFKDYLKKNIKSKHIKIISKEISAIDAEDGSITINKKKHYYDLVILCVGKNSNFYTNLLCSRTINKDYNEISITGNVAHNLKINHSSQYFLKEGPLAILPYKKKNFSLVWSLNKIFFQEKKDNLKKFIESKLNFLFKKKNNFSILNLQFHPIHLSLRKNYHKNNFVILGEGLHSIHPIAGQGFNLIIRDIKKLFEELENNLNLGLPIKNSLILKNFYDIRKPENILISLGIDFTNTFFKKNKLLDPFKNLLLEQVNNNNIKKFSKIISDRGLY